MAVFASEAAVRLRSQVSDVAVADSALVDACIAEAHERILAVLDVAVDVSSPPDGLVHGETVLAAGLLFRALSSRDATEQVELQIGGQRVGAGQKFASLMSMARRFEKEAEKLLAHYGAVPDAWSPGDVTATSPVIGTGA
jgi:hypothetical protein